MADRLKEIEEAFAYSDRLAVELPQLIQPEKSCYHILTLASYARGLLEQLVAAQSAWQIVKDCCDRQWEDETPHQIATIASNAMFWRNTEIRKLRDELAALRERTKEK